MTPGQIGWECYINQIRKVLRKHGQKDWTDGITWENSSQSLRDDWEEIAREIIKHQNKEGS